MSVEYGERITRVETRLAGVEEDVSMIKTQLNTVATKEDVQEVRLFFEKRDDLFTSKLWKLAFGLVIAITAITFAFVGVREIPKLF